ncbi:MAG: hypothetical protein NTV74_07895 [Euryarchaeota archaeon]|nr:hypothetical protein [Euryarchaeota archaeon]
MKKLPIDFSFLLIKTISMALIITIPLSFLSFSERPLIGIFDIENSNIFALSLLAISWGLMCFVKYFEVNKRKDEGKITIQFFIELSITAVISIILITLIYVVGVFFAIVFLIYFTIFYLIIKYGLKKWLNSDS